MKNIYLYSASIAIFSALTLFTVPTSAADNASGTSSTATTAAAQQMLPPTTATGGSCVGSNSILSMNGNGTGGDSAITCSPAKLDTNGNFSTGGSASLGGGLTVGGTITNNYINSDPSQSNNGVYYGTNITTNGRFMSGDMGKGGNGGLWVAMGSGSASSPASAQFFGSMDATHFGLWNQAAGSPTVASNWRLIVDSTGNVGIDNQNPQYALDVNGTVNVSGTTAGGTVIGSTTVTTANNLAAASACAANNALTKNSDGSFSCVQVTDLVGVGKVTVPTCTSGKVLTFDGSSFSCVLQTAAAPIPPDCTGSNVLQWNASSAAYQCVPISSLTGGAGASCPVGYYLTTARLDYSGDGTFQYIGTSFPASAGIGTFIGVGEPAAQSGLRAANGALSKFTSGMASGQIMPLLSTPSSGDGAIVTTAMGYILCYNGEIIDFGNNVVGGGGH